MRRTRDALGASEAMEQDRPCSPRRLRAGTSIAYRTQKALRGAQPGFGDVPTRPNTARCSDSERSIPRRRAGSPRLPPSATLPRLPRSAVVADASMPLRALRRAVDEDHLAGRVVAFHDARFATRRLHPLERPELLWVRFEPHPHLGPHQTKVALHVRLEPSLEQAWRLLAPSFAHLVCPSHDSPSPIRPASPTRCEQPPVSVPTAPKRVVPPRHLRVAIDTHGDGDRDRPRS